MDLEIDNKRIILSKESYFQKNIFNPHIQTEDDPPAPSNVVIMMMKMKLKMAIIR